MGTILILPGVKALPGGWAGNLWEGGLEHQPMLPVAQMTVRGRFPSGLASSPVATLRGQVRWPAWWGLQSE